MEDECDLCSGPPPPQFLLPPPPRPPFLLQDQCSEEAVLPSELCDAFSVIDAELHSSPAIPSVAVIVVCSILLLAMVLIASVLVWKYKRKPRILMPCKGPPPPMPRDDVSDGVAYDRPLPTHSVEMVDLKPNVVHHRAYRTAEEPTVFICSDPYAADDLYNPVYQELSPVSTERGESDIDSEIQISEDDFAEDELSVGEAPPRRSRAPPPPPPPYSYGPHRRPHIAAVEAVRFQAPVRGRRNQAFAPGHQAHRRPPVLSVSPAAHTDFHEGILFDTLMYHYKPQSSEAVAHHYASTPCYGDKLDAALASFRPTIGHDSDSGYSHNTSSGMQGRHSGAD